MGILIFVVMLVVLIVGHEFGHFLVAKRMGMEVPEFGIGFPPKVWSFVRGTTEYSINALPFGGFVRIVGENGDHDHPNAFTQKAKWAQAAVLFAGPGMNIVLGFVAFWIAFMVGFPTAVEDGGTAVLSNARVVVSEVVEGSPADRAGLLVGDTMQSITVDGVTVLIDRPTDVSDALKSAPEQVILTTERSGEARAYTLVPERGVITQEPERLALGVGSLIIAEASYGFFESLWRALVATYNGLVAIVTGIAGLIAGAFTLSASLEDISGPVGIASVVSDAARIGWGQVLAFAGIISLNLAVLNLLPFPALDGGRLLFLGVEVVRGRAVSAKVSSAVNTVGFVLLILLMLVVTWNDIAKLIM
jgi:regulator of sigma E protease